MLSLPALWVLLWLGSHAFLGWAILAAAVFSLANHLPFSLMHEAVHGVFSPNKRRNDFFGVLAGAVFPTSFTMQRVAHLGHHRRNRTDEELYDYYLPTESRFSKTRSIYAGNLFGLYWFCIPLSNLIFLLWPWLYSSKWFVEGPARSLGFEPYVREIAELPKLRIWLECALAFVYQLLVWVLLDLTWQGWLLCYWAFAVHWSALQYVDHAWSPRDIVNGAWNLKVLPITSAIALNYHYHLAHHRHPQVPWPYLPGLVEDSDPRPTFWSIYFRLWGGARPAPPMNAGSTLE
ncbi:MAG: fatty acid desaturase [Gammaproteobacteria bacterium]|nr:fatty acid desaturase [Gammaproteobacteria bacterium]